MRHFRHLSKDEIMEIVLQSHKGVPSDVLAARFQCDRSTITYHVRKYEAAYEEQESAYAIIKSRIKKVCLHPSSKCTLCGVMKDELYRNEWRRIEELTAQLEDANRKLRRAGLLAE